MGAQEFGGTAPLVCVRLHACIHGCCCRHMVKLMSARRRPNQSGGASSRCGCREVCGMLVLRVGGRCRSIEASVGCTVSGGSVCVTRGERRWKGRGRRMKAVPDVTPAKECATQPPARLQLRRTGAFPQLSLPQPLRAAAAARPQLLLRLLQRPWQLAPEGRQEVAQHLQLPAGGGSGAAGGVRAPAAAAAGTQHPATTARAQASRAVQAGSGARLVGSRGSNDSPNQAARRLSDARQRSWWASSAS
jgi:hypothetical protein